MHLLHVLFHALFGILAPLNPSAWPFYVRRLRAANGGVPPMVMLAALGVLAFGNAGIGVFGNNLIVKVINYVSIASWFAVAIPASAVVLVDSARNIRRLGIDGMSRPRLWFEIARSAWISCVFAALTYILALVIVRKIPLPRWVDFVFAASGFLFIVFMVSSTTGYVLAWLAKRRGRGRAYECVEFFYPMCLISTAMCVLLVCIGMQNVQVVLGFVVAAAIGAVLLLKIVERSKRKNSGLFRDVP